MKENIKKMLFLLTLSSICALTMAMQAPNDEFFKATEVHVEKIFENRVGFGFGYGEKAFKAMYRYFSSDAQQLAHNKLLELAHARKEDVLALIGEPGKDAWGLHEAIVEKKTFKLKKRKGCLLYVLSMVAIDEDSCDNLQDYVNAIKALVGNNNYHAYAEDAHAAMIAEFVTNSERKFYGLAEFFLGFDESAISWSLVMKAVDSDTPTPWVEWLYAKAVAGKKASDLKIPSITGSQEQFIHLLVLRDADESMLWILNHYLQLLDPESAAQEVLSIGRKSKTDIWKKLLNSNRNQNDNFLNKVILALVHAISPYEGVNTTKSSTKKLLKAIFKEGQEGDMAHALTLIPVVQRETLLQFCVANAVKYMPKDKAETYKFIGPIFAEEYRKPARAKEKKSIYDNLANEAYSAAFRKAHGGSIKSQVEAGLRALGMLVEMGFFDSDHVETASFNPFPEWGIKPDTLLKAGLTKALHDIWGPPKWKFKGNAEEAVHFFAQKMKTKIGAEKWRTYLDKKNENDVSIVDFVALYFTKDDNNIEKAKSPQWLDY